MVKEIEEHQKEGREVVIISSTLDFIVHAFCRTLQIEHAFSTELAVKDGFYTGEVVGIIPYGESKESILEKFAQEKGVVLDESFAYGDHFSDRFMLQRVGTAVVIASDEKLESQALKNNWNIRELTIK